MVVRLTVREVHATRKNYFLHNAVYKFGSGLRSFGRGYTTVVLLQLPLHILNIVLHLHTPRFRELFLPFPKFIFQLRYRIIFQTMVLLINLLLTRQLSLKNIPEITVNLVNFLPLKIHQIKSGLVHVLASVHQLRKVGVVPVTVVSDIFHRFEVAVSAVVELDLLVIKLVEVVFYTGYWDTCGLWGSTGFSGAISIRRRRLLVSLVVLVCGLILVVLVCGSLMMVHLGMRRWFMRYILRILGIVRYILGFMLYL